MKVACAHGLGSTLAAISVPRISPRSEVLTYRSATSLYVTDTAPVFFLGMNDGKLTNTDTDL